MSHTVFPEPQLPQLPSDTMARHEEKPLLEVRGLSKSFFATQAASNVSFTVGRGEIVSLLGENGAGKSTVIKMLAGVYKPDSGSVLLGGNDLNDAGVRQHLKVVHQNLGLIEWMTVAENIAQTVGYPRRFGLINSAQMNAQATQVLESIGAELDPEIRVFDLPRAERSLLTIARAVVTKPDLLILDEPTASLPASDVERLFSVLRTLQESGVGMIYVSHRLDEIYQISSRVVVMRNGRVVAEREVAGLDHSELVELIVGHHTTETVFDEPDPTVRLQLDQLVASGAGPVSLQVRKGEVLALCGLRGAGQDAIGRVIAGVIRPTSGAMHLDGKPLKPHGTVAAVHDGVGFATSNREEEAVAAGLSVRENLFLNPSVWGWHGLKFRTTRSERDKAAHYITSFGVRPTDPELSLDTLSGGNQQKVILARWFGVGRKVIVLEEPTMGVDIGAKADIYALLRDSARNGTAVIVISTDMEEVVKIAHRALVFERGHIAAELDGGQLTIAHLVAAASHLQ